MYNNRVRYNKNNIYIHVYTVRRRNGRKVLQVIAKYTFGREEKEKKTVRIPFSLAANIDFRSFSAPSNLQNTRLYTTAIIEVLIKTACGLSFIYFFFFFFFNRINFTVNGTRPTRNKRQVHRCNSDSAPKKYK
jgi:hypothetical protein